MSCLIVDKAERVALEAQFAKMQEAGTLPGGVMLGIPVEAEDGRFVYCDARWDAKETETDTKAAISKRLDVMKADVKVGVTAKTKVEEKLPKDFLTKTEAVVAPEKIVAK